ncbi:MAG TPA: nickel-dependent hydrogenase large subunit [Candidatus Binataceae bacterium]|nr:nickel-dependent hydrogenase large subunit [Candidatus Binataceae bacterium]
MKTIKVDCLARVEGEGALRIRFKGDEIRDVELRIFEPPRFFEAFLRGRSWLEVPDITARICGICPVAYQMSSCAAMEDAAGVRVDGALALLRRLLYCGEWIESHALHIFMLHAPDFLGFPDAIAMAREHREMIARGLRIKKAGNAIVDTVGGRAIHPVNVRVGGFYRAPTRAELAQLRPELAAALEDAVAAADWLRAFDFPALERDYEFVSVRGDDGYPLIGRRLISNHGLDIDIADYDAHFEEHHVARSNALHSTIKGRDAYLCGPMARFNLNFDQLRPLARETAGRLKIPVPCRNPFMSILIRIVEVIQALDEAIAIIDSYAEAPESFVEVAPREAVGFGCSEAPRGALYHRYQIGADGIVRDAKIVPPTSQNQKSMEDDLVALAPQLIAMEHKAATARAEHALRNYDPCISCATHFLKLTLESE